MLKPRCSHEVNKPKASRVRACGVSFPPLNRHTLSLSRALVVVLVESGISNVKMKKEARTYEKATKKKQKSKSKSNKKNRVRAQAPPNRKKDGVPFDKN